MKQQPHGMLALRQAPLLTLPQHWPGIRLDPLAWGVHHTLNFPCW